MPELSEYRKDGKNLETNTKSAIEQQQTTNNVN